MSLSTNIHDAFVRAATQDKHLRTLINGNLGDLSSLATADKSNLLNAINEVHARIATAAGIDDAATSTSKTWSSRKTRDEIDAASVEDRKRANATGTQSADTVTDGTTNKSFTASERTKLAGVEPGATANATNAQLRDRGTHTGTQLAATISDFVAAVDARVQMVVDAAPAALDTLNELAAAIGDDANFAGTVNTALGNRVRVDAVQALTGPQQAQARANIDAVSAAAVGPTDTSFVASYEGALA